MSKAVAAAVLAQRGFDPHTFQPINREELERELAVGRIRCRRILIISLLFHLTLMILINVFVWTLYYPTKSADEYNWPPWVTLATSAALLFHAASALPVIFPCACIPSYILIVTGDIIVVNLLVWAVYALSCGWLTATTVRCTYLWPKWVSAGTAAALLGFLILSFLCHAILGDHPDIDEDEIHDEIISHREIHGSD